MEFHSPNLPDHQQDNPVTKCIACEGEIYDPSELMCPWEGGKMHESCLDEKFMEMTFSEKAELFGEVLVRAGD